MPSPDGIGAPGIASLSCGVVAQFHGVSVKAVALRAAGRAAAASMLFGAASVALVSCGPFGEPDGSEIRRVVVISIDTLRADALGCYGQAASTTPNIDRLAAAGLRFEHAIAPAPQTFPSHATLLTGVHPLTHGIVVNAQGVFPSTISTLAERLRDAGWITGAIVSSSVLHRQYGLDRGFATYRDDFFRNLLTPGEARLVPEATAGLATSAAIAWLDEAKAAPLAFLFLHYMDPHTPYAPPAPFRARFPGHPYLGEVAYVDAEIGRFLEHLRTIGWDASTVIVLTSDHGESLGAHGEETHGYFLYDEVIRVPLILRGPSVPSGRVVDEAVGLIDITPTILSLVGLEPDPSLPGRSLLDPIPADRTVMSVSYTAARAHGWSALWSLWRRGEKLILAPTPEYYRTDADPAELENQFHRWPERAQTLERELREKGDAYLAKRRAQVQPLTLDERSREQLAALGYAADGADEGDRLETDFTGSDPKDMGPVIELVRQYYLARTQQQYDRAEALLQAIRDRDPDNRLPDRELSLVLLLTGRNQALVDWMAAQPESFRAQPLQAYRLAVALGRLGRYSEAIALLQRNLERDPANRESRYELAALTASDPGRSQMERRAALDDYRQLLHDEPMNTSARSNLATLLSLNGQNDAARRELETLLAQDPDNVVGRRNLGVIYARLGEKEKAVAELDAYLRLAPNASDRGEIERMAKALRDG